MSVEVCGVDLSEFVNPMKVALGNCQVMSEDRIQFGSNIPDFELTPNRPNSARTATNLIYLGEKIGMLTFIAYSPGDGTGDESLYLLNDVRFADGASTNRRIPRSKQAMWGEAHIVVAAADPDNTDNSPVIGAGGLEVVTFIPDTRTIHRGFVLGANPEDIEQQMSGEDRVSIARTITCGPDGMLQDIKTTGDRFGDPHATFNPTRFVQVCAYFGITHLAPINQRHIFGHLQARQPKIS